MLRNINKHAKTFFTISTGKICTNLTPIGAVKKLKNATIQKAGKDT